MPIFKKKGPFFGHLQVIKDLKDNEKWLFNNSSGINLEHSNPGIKGKIQINNAATALQAIYCCEGISLNRAKIDDGLKNSKIFGRFQIIEDGHITILDIAHNTQSLGILFNNLKKYFPDRNYHAVFSVLKDKDINGMLELSKNILKALNGRKACLIGNHGQIAFEENLPKAFELAEEVENISLQYITSLKLGKPKILSIKEMKKVLSKAKNYKKDS